MNKILILGGSGFIGNKLYRELNKFYKTFSTYNNKTKNKENSHFYYFRMEELNINILLNRIKPNIIISCLRGDFELQVLTHREICNYVKRFNCKIFFLSSSNVFDITITSPVGEIIVDSPSCSTPSSMPALAADTIQRLF